MEKLHFRILVLDNDIKEQRNLENYILSTLVDKEKLNFEDTVIRFISTEEQLTSVPQAAAYNSIWINIAFPNWKQLAQQLYLDNPFCYQVLYGRKIVFDHESMRSRPIGYVILRDFRKIEAVENGNEKAEIERCFYAIHKEMDVIAKYYSAEDDMLPLKTRSSIYWVPYSSILYLQSSGRKTYIYVNAKAVSGEYKEEDSIVKSLDNSEELFAYVQNKKLDDIYEHLDSNRFIRIHKSYVINKSHILGVSKNKYSWILTVIDKENRTIQLPISEPYHEVIDGMNLGSPRGI